MPEWPPIAEPELLRRLALDDAGFCEFIRGVVAQLPSRECDEAAIARALSYPWARPLGSYLLSGGGLEALAAMAPDRARRGDPRPLHRRRRRPPAAAGDRLQRGAGGAASASSPTSPAEEDRARPRPDRPPARVRRRRRRPADDVRLAAGDPLPQPRHRGRRHPPLGHPGPVHPARLVGAHLPPRPAAGPLRGRGGRRRLRRGAGLRLPLRRLLPRTASRSPSPRSRPAAAPRRR